MNLQRIGVELEHAGIFENYIPLLGPGGHVKFSLRWDEIELSPGRYTWSPDIDAGVKLMANRPLVICLKLTPKHYRLPPVKSRCSPPQSTYLDYWKNFVRAVARRYNPAFIEVWNEPECDAKTALIAGVDSYFGGFGLTGKVKVFMGKKAWKIMTMPEYYGYFVSQTVEALKGTGVGVLAGALMMTDSQSGTTFWRGARRYAHGYDAVSYHSYTLYAPRSEELILNSDQRINVRMDFSQATGWNFTDWDLPGLRASAMRETGEVAPLVMTETNLLFGGNANADYLAKQAEYIDYCYKHLDGWGISAMTIYAMFSGWNNANLLGSGKTKLPAWYKYAELTTL